MKYILITGASRGIGYETALKLAGKGNHVIAVARSHNLLMNLTGQTGNGNIVPVTADLTASEGIAEIMACVNTIPQLDVLINNAGTLINKSFMETTLDEWKYVMDINLFSVIRLIKSLRPKMMRGSHIVNISSMGGFQGSEKFPGLSAYSTSKGALAILTESLSSEFGEEDISVNCLCLGAVQTEMLNMAFPGYKAPVQPEQMADFIADFSLSGNLFFNGKILPVSLNNPQ